MTRVIGPAALAGAIALCALSRGADGQAPRGSDTLSAAQVADSLAVISEIDAALRVNNRDGAAWHRRGVIAWSLAERARHDPPIAGLQRIALTRAADSSLRAAVDRAPRNALHQLTLGKFLLASGVSTTRAAAYAHFERALMLARTGLDSLVWSESAVEVGRTQWRRYEALADRWIRIAPGDACAPFTGLMVRGMAGDSWDPVSEMSDGLRACAQRPAPGFPGETEYAQAEAAFREAHRVGRSNPRAFQQLAMLLGERNRWAELSALASDRVSNAPDDAWAWMTLALGNHRSDRDFGATYDAFSRAFTLLPETEQQRLNHLERVYNPRDSGSVGPLTSVARFAKNRLYWLAATPLWSRLIQHPQFEFLARVAYAELRWSVDELGVRGADTDRGDVYIRYGPPHLVVSFRGTGPGATYAKWTYLTGLVFTFDAQPTFGTAHIRPEHQAVFFDIVSLAPVRWPRERTVVVDSMAVQVARFRASWKLIEIVVATAPPIDSIRRSTEYFSSPREDFWLLAGGTVQVVRDSLIPRAPGPAMYRHTVPPRAYLFRVEASAEGARVAVRASGTIASGATGGTTFSTTGFGLSDVLVAERVNAPASAPQRWSDLAVVPLVGAARRGNPVSLVWENYDLAARDGAAQYSVTITLQRTSRDGRGRLAARLIGTAARLVTGSQTADRVVVAFDRTAPHQSVLVDHVTLDLGETAPGDYHLTVEVSDLTSGNKASRTARLVVGT